MGKIDSPLNGSPQGDLSAPQNMPFYSKIAFVRLGFPNAEQSFSYASDTIKLKEKSCYLDVLASVGLYRIYLVHNVSNCQRH